MWESIVTLFIRSTMKPKNRKELKQKRNVKLERKIGRTNDRVSKSKNRLT